MGLNYSGESLRNGLTCWAPWQPSCLGTMLLQPGACGSFPLAWLLCWSQRSRGWAESPLCVITITPCYLSEFLLRLVSFTEELHTLAGCLTVLHGHVYNHCVSRIVITDCIFFVIFRNEQTHAKAEAKTEAAPRPAQVPKANPEPEDLFDDIWPLLHSFPHISVERMLFLVRSLLTMNGTISIINLNTSLILWTCKKSFFYLCMLFFCTVKLYQ